MDDNVVAYIYPALGTAGYHEALRCIDGNENNPGYLPPAGQAPKAQPKRSEKSPRQEREGTVDESDKEQEDHDYLRNEPCIKVTFDHIPKTTYGLRAGRSDVAELRLPDIPGVSLLHFTLTFDANYRLIVRDLGSTRGTTVIYDEMERTRRSHFDWIVGGSDFLKEVGRIIVKVTSDVQFQLVVPHQNIQDASYKAKVDRFRAGTTDPEPLLDLDHVGLLSRIRTQQPSGVQTPGSPTAKDVEVTKEIGQGTFAVVYRVWNVSTDEQYARKIPKKRVLDPSGWERELLIMDRIQHKHIVALLNSSPLPSPWLDLEYLPGGSVGSHLESGRPFSRFEGNQILAQASDALAYLHTLQPQIVHRDVTPNNILICHRRPGDILIKFADFGLSREGDALRTICGTYLYLAPEVYEANDIPLKWRPAYTALVDVWSLGVVLVELLVGLPSHRGIGSMGVEWCKKICRESAPGHERNELLDFVLQSMLCLRPEDRKPATECHKEALRLLDSSSDDSDSVVSGGGFLGSLGSGASTIRPGQAQGLGHEDLSVEVSSARYIISNPERVQPCDTPSPKAPRIDLRQFIPRFTDPEDSLFYKSSFGGESYDEFSSIPDSVSTAVMAHQPQGEQEFPGSAEAALEVHDPEHEPWDDLPAEFLPNAPRHHPVEETETAIGVGAYPTMSHVKRSRAVRSPRVLSMESGRTVKRSKTETRTIAG